MCRSGSGLNQLEKLFIEYPMLTTCGSTPPPTTSKPTKENKAKGKAKTAGKNKKKQVTMPHDSPVMGTRSTTPLTSIALPHILEAKESFTARSECLVDAIHYV